MRMPLVVKKDGRREPFEKQKLVAGLRLACRKRPIPEALIEQTADAIERTLQDLGEREVPAAEIGRRVLASLKDLDPVAYLRFASVYYELDDAEAFLQLVSAVQGQEQS